MATMKAHRRLRACVSIAVVLAALPGGASAHPGHGAQPAPPIQNKPESSGGGASPLVVGGVVVGLLGLTGGLIALKQSAARHGSGESARGGAGQS